MKKQQTAKQEQYYKRHAANRLKRRQEELARRSAEKEKKDIEFFRRRVSDAPDKKALVTKRTKAYYRFAKDYPNEVDSEGYRENRPESGNPGAKKTALAALVCAAVFLLAFTLSLTGVKLSERSAAQTDPGASGDSGPSAVKAYHMTYPELLTGDADGIRAAAEAEGCNTVLIDFKDEDGYVYFETGTVVGASGDRKTASGYKTVKALEESGIRTAAYISCFKDTLAVEGKPDFGVTDYDDPENVLADNNGDKWLDPFNTEVSDYLLNIIKKAAGGGFSYILLDNVCAATELGLKTAFYPSVADADANLNYAFRTFLSKAVGITGAAKLIVMCDAYGFTASDTNTTNRYGGNLLCDNVIHYAVDSRVSYRADTANDPEGLFRYIDEMPSVFVLDSAALAKKGLKENEKTSGADLFVCIEAGDGADSGFDRPDDENTIYW